MMGVGELACQGGAGTQGSGGWGALRQSLRTQQALEPVVTMSSQAVPDARSMSGTNSEEETSR